MARRWTAPLALVPLVFALPARAADPLPAAGTDTAATPAPSSDDEWSQKIHAGMKSEGAQSQADLDREQADADALAARRARLRFFVDAAIGDWLLNLRGIGTEEAISVYGDTGYLLELGGGLRVGLSALWQFQARVAIEYSHTASGGETVCTTACYALEGITIVEPSVEATFRLAFSRTSPFFVGLGPKLGVIVASSTATQSYNIVASSPPTTSFNGTAGFLGAVLEVGALFGPNDAIEVAVRPFVGAQTGENVGNIGGAVLAGAYAF